MNHPPTETRHEESTQASARHDLAQALRRAFNLGQTYWQQADSDSIAQQRRSDETRAKFEAMVAEVLAADARLYVTLQAQASAPQVVEPIPMLLHCPKCGTQHVDAPKPKHVHQYGSAAGQYRVIPAWDNPPHRSHLCHHCGCIWRPADVPTTGVKAIATKGKADTWDQGFADSACAQLRAPQASAPSVQVVQTTAAEAYLCFAWGETDLPDAEFATDREGVRQFIIREWLGSEDSVGGDDEPMLPRIMAEFDEHDFGDGPLVWEFEIGGVKITKVFARAAAPEASAQPAAPHHFPGAGEMVEPAAPNPWRDAVDAALVAAGLATGLADHIEQRLRTWRESTMNKSGDRLALDDFMGQDSIEDLIDFVCDEWALAALQSAPDHSGEATDMAPAGATILTRVAWEALTGDSLDVPPDELLSALRIAREVAAQVAQPAAPQPATLQRFRTTFATGHTGALYEDANGPWVRYEDACAAVAQPAATIERERDQLRAAQAAAVMPLIGPLCDAWDGMDNDTKATVRDEAPGLAKALSAIGSAMESDAPAAQPAAEPGAPWPKALDKVQVFLPGSTTQAMCQPVFPCFDAMAMQEMEDRLLRLATPTPPSPSDAQEQQQ